MKKEVAKKWVDALRSGNYLQAHGRIRDKCPVGGYRYCCLGVLTKLAEDEGIEVPSWYTTLLPKTVQKWAEMDGNPMLKSPEGEHELSKSAIRLNDQMQLSFLEIADWIEATFLR